MTTLLFRPPYGPYPGTGVTFTGDEYKFTTGGGEATPEADLGFGDLGAGALCRGAAPSYASATGELKFTIRFPEPGRHTVTAVALVDVS